MCCDRPLGGWAWDPVRSVGPSDSVSCYDWVKSGHMLQIQCCREASQHRESPPETGFPQRKRTGRPSSRSKLLDSAIPEAVLPKLRSYYCPPLASTRLTAIFIICNQNAWQMCKVTVPASGYRLRPGERSRSSEEDENSDGTLEALARDPVVAGVTVLRQSLALASPSTPTGFSFPYTVFSCLKHPKV